MPEKNPVDQNKNISYEQRLNKEIDKRLQTMEKADYVYPVRFGKGDYLVVFLVGLFCLIFLIVGAFL